MKKKQQHFHWHNSFFVCRDHLLYKLNHARCKFMSQRFPERIIFQSDKKENRTQKPAMRKIVLFFTFLCIFGKNFANQTVKGGKTPITEKSVLDNLSQEIVESLKKLDGQGKLELIELHSATHQMVAGMEYEIIAKLKENNTPVDCTIVMWGKPWMAKFLKLDIECGEEKRKYSYATDADVDERFRRQTDDYQFDVQGGYSTVSEDGLNNYIPQLSTIFSQLSSQNTDFDSNQFVLKRIVSGKYQVVAGYHSVLQVEVAPKDHPDQVKHCKVDIYENLKIEIEEVNMKCDCIDKTFHYKKQ